MGHQFPERINLIILQAPRNDDQKIVLAKFRHHLSADTARVSIILELTALFAADDGDRTKIPLSLLHGSKESDPLRTDGRPIGAIFYVTAGIYPALR